MSSFSVSCVGRLLAILICVVLMVGSFDSAHSLGGGDPEMDLDAAAPPPLHHNPPPPPMHHNPPPPPMHHNPPPPPIRSAAAPPPMHHNPPPPPMRSATAPPPMQHKPPPPPMHHNPPPPPTRSAAAPPPMQHKPPPPPMHQKPPPPPMRSAAAPPPMRSSIAVQGVVYCKSCKFPGVTLTGASPLPGGIVKLVCNNGRRGLVVEGKTDNNGYFFIQPGKVTNFGARKCKVFLASSPSQTCNRPTDINGGVTGAPLRFEKEVKAPKPLTLYSTGPFAFGPSSCPHFL